MKAISVREELVKHPQGTFLDLAEFNSANFSACSIQGVSPVWEMHPDTDEFFYILEGEFIIAMREDDGISDYVVSTGEMFVVPRGLWHKPSAPEGAKFLYFTPGQTLHSELEDPLKQN